MVKINKKRFISFVAFIAFGITNLNVHYVMASQNKISLENERIIKSETIGKGIEYTRKQVNIKSNNYNKKEIANIVKLDLNDKDVKVITSKAEDKVKALENLSKQIQREVKKDKNVIAGINGDMFNVREKISTGPQVMDGKLLVNYAYKCHEKMLPVFGIKDDGTYFIKTLDFIGQVKSEDDNYKINIDYVNREPRNGTVMAYTREYARDGVINLSSLKGDTVCLVLEGDNFLKLDEDLSCVVRKVIPGNKNYLLNRNDLLIVANGRRAAELKNTFKEGCSLKVNVSFSEKGIVELMGGYNYLVRNGVALTEEQMLNNGAESYIVKSKSKARTAIGITEDNKLIAVTVDGGNSSKAVSDGLTLPDMAKLMEGEKAVVAMNLDGGGSTQMNVKPLLEDNCVIANKPSDGWQRSITNALLFLSLAPKTGLAKIIYLNDDFTIYKNSNYKLSMKAVDTNYNKMDEKWSSVKWQLNSLGSVDEKGIFKAFDGAGSGKIEAVLDEAKDEINIKVIDSIPNLSFVDKSPIFLQKLGSKKFDINIKDENGNNVIVNDEFINWKVEGDIGTISKDGVFKAVNKKAKGKITVQIGDKSTSIDVEIGKDPVIFDDFEHRDNSRYKISGYALGNGWVTAEQHKSGKYSFKLNYDLANKKWTRRFNGTVNVNTTFKDSKGKNIKNIYTSLGKPSKMGMWVYGDGKAPWLRAVIKDASGKEHTVNFAQRINWKGWRYLTATLPKEINSSVELSSIYLVETNKKSNLKGFIYLDDVTFIY
ncbi:phosphodiester glycosidase family protein [Haloimpatiens sp. FM7315]|uniref:phosphodiester glycosidase family protein n=1 Tax=Haloimpatiens sp. FM7315 TaxID=3298609 RepID=UPI00370BCA58